MTIKLYYGGKRLYSNRIIGEELGDPDYTFENINFIQGDGINTTLTLNNVNADEGPSYLTSTDDDGVTTEWFVLSSNKTRKNQLVLNLRRDFLDERWDDLVGLPFLCNKASYITPITSNAQYLKTTSLSQVKTSQTKLVDRENGQGWLVGYIEKDFIHKYNSDDTLSSMTFSADQNAYDYDYLVNSLTDNTTDIYRYIHTGVRRYTEITSTLDTYFPTAGTVPPQYREAVISLNLHTGTKTDIDSSNKSELEITGGSAGSAIAAHSIPIGKYILQNLNEYVTFVNNALIQGNAAIATYLREDLNYITGSLDAYDGKILKDNSTGYRYKVKVTDITQNMDSWFNYKDLRVSYIRFKNAVGNALEDNTHNWFVNWKTITGSENGLTSKVSITRQVLSLSRIPSDNDTVTIRTSRMHTTDALYDIFAIPLGGNIKVATVMDASEGGDPGDVTVDETTIDCSNMTQVRAVQLIEAMRNKLGSGGVTYLYDVQWLPYGPISDGDTLYDQRAETAGVFSGYSFSPITNSGDNIGVMIWLQSAQLTRSIEYNEINLPEDLTERRIYEEEHLVRLVGPNFASQFEFSPVRNDGIERFNIYIQYRPYSPYIRIVPKFGGLYGINANDSRGLILTGDYSIDSISSNWTTYKLQNKNYELIFNRQIQSMDLQNEYQNNLARQASISEGLGIVTSTISSASRGAGTGFMMGGGVGAAIGGVVSGVSSLAGGITDYIYNQQNREAEKAIREDTRDAAMDNFQYQIGNIKAMPDTITKISTFNPDYQIYPIIEVYTCTDQEDYNLRQAIKYNGIDINEMTFLSDYTKGYISGTLVQIDGLNLNDAQAMALNSELEYGIYYKEV